MDHSVPKRRNIKFRRGGIKYVIQYFGLLNILENAKKIYSSNTSMRCVVLADVKMTSLIVLVGFCEVPTIHCQDKSFFLSFFFLFFVSVCYTCTWLFFWSSNFLISTLPYIFENRYRSCIVLLLMWGCVHYSLSVLYVTKTSRLVLYGHQLQDRGGFIAKYYIILSVTNRKSQSNILQYPC
jgi:hypothetical protein